MRVYCRGSDRKSQKLAKDIAKFCASKLMSQRLAQKLTITIKFEKDLQGIEGDCEWLDEDLRPKDFIIRISDNIPLSKKLKCICHEMVHVKQYARDEMKQMFRPYNTTRFMGQYYTDDMDYWEQPWEIEAYGREPGLYTNWVDSNNYTNDPELDTRMI